MLKTLFKDFAGENILTKCLIVLYCNWLQVCGIIQNNYLYNCSFKDGDYEKKIDGFLGHGFRFRRQCRRLKRNYGLHIPIHSNFKYKKKIFIEYLCGLWGYS